MKPVLAVLGVVGLIVLGVAVTWEVPIALVFGWVVFVFRVLPRVTVDWPSIAVGVAATVLFAGGVHWLGTRWRPWKVRWTLATVVVIYLLFGAGLSMIALVHQTAWLVRDGRPLVVEGVRTWQGGAYAQLREMGLSIHNSHDSLGRLPSGGTFTPQGDMLHGWEIHLLPYIGYDTKRIDFNRPWNDPVNAKYFRSVLPVFINPGFRNPALKDAQGFGLSHYAANSHVMAANTAMKFSDITDGTSTTILIGEVNARFQPWGHPVNWRDPGRGISRSASGFGGPTGLGYTLFTMADGSVKFVSDRVSPQVLRALATPRGGEEINEEDLDR